MNPWQVGCGVFAIVVLSAGAVYASGFVVPEIDGGTAVTALGLLTGGVLMLRSYWRSR